MTEKYIHAQDGNPNDQNAQDPLYQNAREREELLPHVWNWQRDNGCPVGRHDIVFPNMMDRWPDWMNDLIYRNQLPDMAREYPYAIEDSAALRQRDEPIAAILRDHPHRRVYKSGRYTNNSGGYHAYSGELVPDAIKGLSAAQVDQLVGYQQPPYRGRSATEAEQHAYDEMHEWAQKYDWYVPPPAAAVTGDGEEPKEDSRPVSRGRGKKGKKVTVKPVPKHEDVAWWRKVKPLLDEGKSERDIAAELGISPALVNKIKATWEGRDGC